MVGQSAMCVEADSRHALSSRPNLLSRFPLAHGAVCLEHVTGHVHVWLLCSIVFFVGMLAEALGEDVVARFDFDAFTDFLTSLPFLAWSELLCERFPLSMQAENYVVINYCTFSCNKTCLQPELVLEESFPQKNILAD